MAMFKKILVTTDGSAHAQKAIGVASDLAAKYDAELVLLHVLLRGKIPESLKDMVEIEHLADDSSTTPEIAPGVPMWMAALATGGDDSKERRQAMAVGQQIVHVAEHAIRRTGARKVRTVVEEGGPADEILRCAQREKPDVIVVGRRGLGTIDRLLLGSVSQKVAQLVECTCIVVK
jgi:nucleotide-binding universal stress UspA family protein